MANEIKSMIGVTLLNMKSVVGLTGTSIKSIMGKEFAQAVVAGKCYWMGGYSTAEVSEIDGLTFATESQLDPSATLASAKYFVCGIASAVSGYSCAGSGGTTIERVQFSNDTRYSVTATLGTNKTKRMGATGSVYGYVAGGETPASNVIDRLKYSDEATSASARVLDDGARRGGAGVTSAVYSYFGGGYNASAKDWIDALNHTDDSSHSVSAVLSTAKYGNSASQSSLHGYWMAGFFASSTKTVDKIVYATESLSSTGRNLSNYHNDAAGNYSSAKAYIAGHDNNSSNIESISFSDDSVIAVTATLVVGRSYMAGASATA